MTKLQKLLLALAVVLVVVALTVLSLERPKRIRREFFEHIAAGKIRGGIADADQSLRDLAGPGW